MKEILRKLTSRKLWMAIAGVATGIAMALGAEGSDVSTIAGAVTTLISAVVYIVIEGKVDAEGVKTTIIEVQDAIEVMNDGTNS